MIVLKELTNKKHLSSICNVYGMYIISGLEKPDDNKKIIQESPILKFIQ